MLRPVAAAILIGTQLLLPSPAASEVGVFRGTSLRACLDMPGGPPSWCRLTRMAHIRGTFEGLAMGETIDRLRRGESTPNGPIWACFAKLGSIDQLVALYEKYETEHPELWETPVPVLLLKSLRPLCGNLGTPETE